MFSIIKRYRELPAAMRPGYLKNIGDHFLKQSRLIEVLQELFPEKDERQVQEAFRRAHSSQVIRRIVEERRRINGAFSKWKLLFLKSALLLLKPETVVETGVAHGSTSAVILETLEENKYGELFSIDLPVVLSGEGKLEPWLKDRSLRFEDVSTVERFDQVGWLVPELLRGRWKLILGDSLEELPKLAQKLTQVDLFLHDSLHLYESMTREFEIIWPHLKAGGVLMADDVFLKNHAALADFSSAVHVPFKTYLQLGVVRKSD